MVKTVFKLWIILMAGASFMAMAQKVKPIEKESPPSETEIICFAAMEKWVCAPASDQQQAKDKAMRLIDEEARKKGVVIQTVQENNQWQDVVIEEPIETQQKTTVNMNPQLTDEAVVVAEPTVQQSINEVRSDQSNNQQSTNRPSSARQSSAYQADTNRSQNFSDWQRTSSSKWTLQAVGTTNLPNLERFITENQLSEQTMSIATTEVKGAPWHIVLVGLFDSRDEAVAFRASAQDQGMTWSTGAWPRPLDGIEIID